MHDGEASFALATQSTEGGEPSSSATAREPPRKMTHYEAEKILGFGMCHTAEYAPFETGASKTMPYVDVYADDRSKPFSSKPVVPFARRTSTAD